MAEIEATTGTGYFDFANDVMADINMLCAEVRAAKALLQMEDDYETREPLLDLDSILFDVNNRLKAVAARLDDSSFKYVSKSAQ